VAAARAINPASKEQLMESVTMSVSGMTCQGCVNSVTRVLKAVPGVEQVSVQLDAGSATVGYDPSRTNPAVLRGVVEDAGYGVTA
jgi:copper chaperone